MFSLIKVFSVIFDFLLKRFIQRGLNRVFPLTKNQHPKAISQVFFRGYPSGLVIYVKFRLIHNLI